MIECIKVHLIKDKGCLIAYVDLYVSGFGMEFLGCSVFSKNGHRWMSLPSREVIDKNDGNKKYFPILKFNKKERQDQFLKEAMESINPMIDKALQSHQAG